MVKRLDPGWGKKYNEWASREEKRRGKAWAFVIVFCTRRQQFMREVFRWLIFLCFKYIEYSNGTRHLFLAWCTNNKITTFQRWGQRAQRSVDSGQPWNPNCMDAYLLWYYEHGKASIMSDAQIMEGLAEDIPGLSQAKLPTMAYPQKLEKTPRLVRPVVC